MSSKSICYALGRKQVTKAAIAILALLVAFLCGLGVGGYYWPFSVTQRLESEFPQRAFLPSSNKAAYTLVSHTHSYFKLNADGKLELQGGLPYRAEGPYAVRRTISPAQAAVVVMDPWADNPTAHLNDFFGKITETRIVPLVKRAADRGHPVIILTNDPKQVNYSTDVHAELEDLIQDGQAVKLYHQNFDEREFAAYLRSHGVESLIYVGFASNMCVIGRQMGMISMKNQGFQIFFVPQASAAIELPDTWDDQSLHASTTNIISQWIAELIDYEDFMQTSPENQSRNP